MSVYISPVAEGATPGIGHWLEIIFFFFFFFFFFKTLKKYIYKTEERWGEHSERC